MSEFGALGVIGTLIVEVEAASVVEAEIRLVERLSTPKITIALA